jgi:protoporphyrinogen/coproporphyrinogen III oxidase
VTERHEVVVVGGGIAGLTAAWSLRDRDVVVLEATNRLGGRIRSESRGDYWLNFGAHVFGGPDTATGRLLHTVGVKAERVPGRLAAAALNGRIVSRGPVETFPFRLPLTFGERVELLRLGVKLRNAVRRYAAVAAPRAGEEPAERQTRILAFMDDRTFADFAGPLGADARALLGSTLTRSSGEPEELAAGYGVGYFHLVWNRGEGLAQNILGGSSTVIDALATGLEGRIRTGARVTSVVLERDEVVVRYLLDGTAAELRARAAVVATPAYVTHDIVGNLPAATTEALAAIPYGPYVVGAFLTTERAAMPWDDIYALATPKRSFSMLFNTANVLRNSAEPRRPGGSLMAYAAAGSARLLAGFDDEGIEQRFLADLHDLYPQTRGIVDEVVITRWERGLPYPRPGRARLQPLLLRSLEPIYLAGDYLGTWYTETAVQTALDAVAALRRRLDSG